MRPSNDSKDRLSTLHEAFGLCCCMAVLLHGPGTVFPVSITNKPQAFARQDPNPYSRAKEICLGDLNFSDVILETFFDTAMLYYYVIIILSPVDISVPHV